MYHLDQLEGLVEKINLAHWATCRATCYGCHMVTNYPNTEIVTLRQGVTGIMGPTHGTGQI